jgi:hypothetical protein
MTSSRNDPLHEMFHTNPNERIPTSAQGFSRGPTFRFFAMEIFPPPRLVKQNPIVPIIIMEQKVTSELTFATRDPQSKARIIRPPSFHDNSTSRKQATPNVQFLEQKKSAPPAFRFVHPAALPPRTLLSQSASPFKNSNTGRASSATPPPEPGRLTGFRATTAPPGHTQHSMPSPAPRGRSSTPGPPGGTPSRASQMRSTRETPPTAAVAWLQRMEPSVEVAAVPLHSLQPPRAPQPALLVLFADLLSPNCIRGFFQKSSGLTETRSSLATFALKSHRSRRKSDLLL